jgi:predicted DNA-binding transcriptional regulator AlpA
MSDSKVLDEREAAELLGCSVALMRKWRLFGEGVAYVKIGRLVRYRQSDIDAFLDSHRVTTGGGR